MKGYGKQVGVAQLIAVVNDDTAFIDMLCELLHDKGYQTVCGYSERNGYEIIRRRKPDLIVLDVRMEHAVSGWNVLELVRLNPQTASIPIIISSADGVFLQQNEERLRAERCDILPKPFKLDELIAKVTAAVGPPSGGTKTDV